MTQGAEYISASTLQNAPAVIDLFDRAAAANLESPQRRGATVHLPADKALAGRLVMTGDLHDNGLNFQRLLKYAALDRSPGNHLVLHEIVHGRYTVNGRDMSVRMLAGVASLKLAYPNQVHVLQANHDLSQARGEMILKAGHSVTEAFNDGLGFLYGDDWEKVAGAIKRFVYSYPLALRCPNGILCSHSLPSPGRMETFDPSVLNRVPTEADLASGGSAHLLVWGRHQTAAQTASLAKTWGVELFVTGHQPAEMGHEVVEPRLLILASDHEHGVALPIDPQRRYTLDELVEIIHPLAAVTV